MINLLNQHNISYIIENNLIPRKHLNMFLHKNLKEMLKSKEYIYIPEYNVSIQSVESDSDWYNLYIKLSAGASYTNNNFYNLISKFQRCVINEIKEHLSNKAAWDD